MKSRILSVHFPSAAIGVSVLSRCCSEGEFPGGIFLDKVSYGEVIPGKCRGNCSLWRMVPFSILSVESRS
ncbi:hypothetical protein R1flu_020138 [Riccia fluitans]|uniref:Secreted protein n=1 Tax=Riccia fluitans TaxID=41844 RepID=A0ABD1ZM48_9MARC